MGRTNPTTSHCPYCALNCGVQYEVNNGGLELVRWKDSPLTGGAICSKGATAHEQVDHLERVRQPLLRQGNDWTEIGWDEALDRTVAGFARISDRHGVDANAVLSGGSLTNEKVYLIGKLARLGFGTRHVDYNGRFCMTSAGAANKMAFGADRMMTPLAELDRADTVVVVGANLAAAFPVAVPQFLERVRGRGGRVVVVDPRSSRFVRANDLHLPIRPGTDSTLFNGLLRQVLYQGLFDAEFISTRTTGFESVVASVEAFTLDRVANECDIDGALIAEAAAAIGGTPRTMYLHGRGPEQQVGGVNNVLSIINLGLACGHVGGPGRGINTLTGQRNGQGGREWGQRCNQLPAGRDIDDPDHRATVAQRWGVDPAALPPSGLTYTEILQAAGRGEVRGLFSICTNMSVSAPDLHRVEEQMAALDHVVMVDPFLSPSTRHADIVLPGSTFLEEEGTITTIEGRVVRCDQATEPVAGRADLDVIRGVAERFGVGDKFAFHHGREVFEEMRTVSSGGFVDYAGITWDRLRDLDPETGRPEGVFWPCPDETHPGTPQLYTERFARPSGLARFVPVTPSAPPEMVDADRPIVLTTGRVLAQFLSGNQTMRIPAQQAKADRPVLEIHPTTAGTYGLIVGEPVEIRSGQGCSVVDWTANDGLRPDTVFLPYHWPECNRLVAAHLDPVSKIPAFKYTPVALAPGVKPTSISLNRASHEAQGVPV